MVDTEATAHGAKMLYRREKLGLKVLFSSLAIFSGSSQAPTISITLCLILFDVKAKDRKGREKCLAGVKKIQYSWVKNGNKINNNSNKITA
jgi:hypothetical protein